MIRLAMIAFAAGFGQSDVALADAEIPFVRTGEAESFTPWAAVPHSEGYHLPTGCPDFEIEAPRNAGGLVVKAADFGLSELRDDNQRALNRALEECRRVGASRLELAPGVYRCHGAEGVSIASFVDFTLDGKGAKLVFFRPREKIKALKQWENRFDRANIFITNCVRTVVRDIEMDWEWSLDPLASFGRIVEKHVDEANDSSWIDYEMDVPHPFFPESVPLLVANAMAESRDRFIPNKGGYWSGNSEGHFGAKNEWVSPTRLRVWPFVKMPGRMQQPDYDRLFSSESNRETVKEAQEGTVFRIQHFYYGESGVAMHSNRHLSLENVHIRACRGFGFLTGGDQHHWQLVDCSIAPASGDVRPITSTADANHVVQSRGWCKLVRCRWRLHQDDMNNFHDRTTLAMKCGPRSLEIVNKRGSRYFPLHAGDELELREDTFEPTSWCGRIVAAEGEVCTMDREVPDEKGSAFVVFNRSFGTDNILVKDCDFTDTSARNLFHGANVTIENCSFKRTCGTPLRFLAVWSYRVWCEGMGCTNVIVRNCKFDSNQIWPWAEKGVSSEILTCIFAPQDVDQFLPVTNARLLARLVKLNAERPYVVKPWQGIISDVLVEGCTFLNPRGAVWHMSDGRNLTFRNNTIRIDVADPDALPYRGSAFVEEAEDVHFSGNRFVATVPTPGAGVIVKSALRR